MKIGNALRICSAAKTRSVKRESLARILQTVTRMKNAGMRSAEAKIDLIDAIPTLIVLKEKLAFIPNVWLSPKTTRRVIPKLIARKKKRRKRENQIGLIGRKIIPKSGMKRISPKIQLIPLIGIMRRRKTPRS